MSLTCLETVKKLNELNLTCLEKVEKLKTLLARKLTIKEIRLIKFLIKNPYHNNPFDVPEDIVFLADNLEGFLFKSKKSPKVKAKSVKSKSPSKSKKSPKVTKKSVEILLDFFVDVYNDDEKVDINNNNAKEVEKWYKQRINFYLKYDKNVKSITIKHVKGNEFTGVYVLYENKNNFFGSLKDEIETMVINPDDDGNYPLKLNKKEYLVSGKIFFFKRVPIKKK